MKRNFGNPFWVLPALVAIGIVAAIAVGLGLGHSTSNTAQAADVSASVTTNPDTAGLVSEVTFKFTTKANIPANTGEFVITFDKDSVVPSSISRNAVLISASNVTGASSGTSTAAGGQSVTLAFDPVFDTDPDDARRVKVTMKIPDMNPSTSDPGVGVQGIEAGADVTVTLTTSAGFRNAEEDDNQGFDIKISATAGGANQIKLDRNGATETAARTRVNATAAVKIFTSSPLRRRGNSLTVIGRGFKGGTSATVWLDNGVDVNGDGVIDNTPIFSINEVTSGINFESINTTALNTGVTSVSEAAINFDQNGDGDKSDIFVLSSPTVPFYEGMLRNNSQRDAGERDLGTAIVGGDGTFTGSFTVQNPPFSPTLLSESGFDLNGNGVTTDTGIPINIINAIDGEGVVPSAANTRTLELQPVLTVQPKEASIGDTITLTLKDFTPSTTVTSVIIGVTPATLPSPAPTIDANGEATFTVKIPGSGVPIGNQTVFVNTATQDHDDTINILGANLSTSHTDLIPNQDLTISGSGFTEGSSTTCINAGKITLSNVALTIDTDSTSADCSGTGVKVTNGGTFVATIIVRATGATPFPSALLTAGTQELKVIDSGGTEGKLNLNVKPRAFNIDPPISGPRKTVTVIGSGYPADNPDTGSSSVTICYDPKTATTCGRQVTVTPDFSGNFREALVIPRDVGIPSTNTVTSTISSGGTSTVDTITHEIPKASVSVNPGRGSSGGKLSISGTGFRDFSTVEAIKIGGLGSLGGRTINTDTNGGFTAADIQIPGLDPGIHSVEVTVGTGALETTANTTFEVLAQGVSGVLTPVQQGLDPLGNSLIRVFYFDNATKGWSFFDPRPEFASANTLTDLADGGIYWVRVTQDQLSVVLNNKTRNLTCLNPGTPQEDCWNQIVW